MRDTGTVTNGRRPAGKFQEVTARLELEEGGTGESEFQELGECRYPMFPTRLETNLSLNHGDAQIPSNSPELSWMTSRNL